MAGIGIQGNKITKFEPKCSETSNGAFVNNAVY
jgi:hypothetical protein